MEAKPEVVFFDVGNTLLFPNWPRILAPLQERGILPTHEQLQAIERRTKPEFDELVAMGRTDVGFWRLFYSHLLEIVEVDDTNLLSSLTESTRLSSNWDRCRPGTREALEDIAAGCRIAVISNADGKIAQVLEGCGIFDCFSSITDSGIVGHEKPHPAIFLAALQSAEVEPERALYVGDLYSVDYLGATNVGMQAILFDVAGAYLERNLPRVESLRQLQQWLKRKP